MPTFRRSVPLDTDTPRRTWRIPLARPSLPPLERLTAALEPVWHARMLSNNGPQAQAFEQAYAAYCRTTAYALCTSSADLALMLTLRALSLPPGSRVVLPSLGYPSTIHAIEWNNLCPHFVDVDPDDWCLHAQQLDGDLSNVSAILATHLFGVPCDLRGLRRVAERCNARLVIDAAHAVATWFDGAHVVDYADASVVSFSGTKMITGAEAGDRRPA